MPMLQPHTGPLIIRPHIRSRLTRLHDTGNIAHETAASVAAPRTVPIVSSHNRLNMPRPSIVARRGTKKTGGDRKTNRGTLVPVTFVVFFVPFVPFVVKCLCCFA